MRRAPETNGTMRAVTDWLSSHKALKCKLFISIAAICKLLKPKTNCHPVETGASNQKTLLGTILEFIWFGGLTHTHPHTRYYGEKWLSWWYDFFSFSFFLVTEALAICALIINPLCKRLRSFPSAVLILKVQLGLLIIGVHVQMTYMFFHLSVHVMSLLRHLSRCCLWHFFCTDHSCFWALFKFTFPLFFWPWHKKMGEIIEDAFTVKFAKSEIT